jgi:hypothetical protein
MKRFIHLLLIPLAYSSACLGESDFVPDAQIPAEVKPFVERGSRLLAIESADLNGDGHKDYVLVLEKLKAKPSDPDLETGQRPLLVLLRKDGALKQVKRNDRIVLCSTCGGMMGDPFAGISAGPKTFSVQHYGGSAWRWSRDYKFNYSRLDDTWQLVRAEESEFHAADPEHTTKTRVFTPPKDYGKIDIANFDPEHYKVRTRAKR